MNKEFDLNLISRAKLNKLVQRYIFSDELKSFSSYLSRMPTRLYLEYDKVLAQIQYGLYGLSGVRLKNSKNIPANGVVPDYMSAMELIRYREAICWTKKTYESFIEDGCPHQRYFYQAAQQIGNDFFDNFKDYHSDFNFIYEGGENIKSSVVKYFNRALKLKLYHKVLSSIPQKSKDGSVEAFNPYTDMFDQYEDYRKKFVQVVDYFSKYNFTSAEIINLFRTYEQAYYNTDFLMRKNIDVINYTLGLSEGTYFSRQDLKAHTKCLDYIIDCITAKVENYDETIEYIKRKALEEREDYISKNIKSGKRPETSDVFLVACLDKIIEERKQKELKNGTILEVEPISNIEYSTTNIQRLLQESIKTLGKMVSASIDDRRKHAKLVQPSLFDLNLIENNPVQKKMEEPCQ